jgi:large subunit ribosomal protein L27
MAHTKSAGSTRNGRDSRSKRLGVKRSDGQQVKNGEIIIRQHGAKFIEGAGVRRAGDDSLYAIKEGVVKFSNKKKVRFDGSVRFYKQVAIVATLAEPVAAPKKAVKKVAKKVVAKK